MLNFIQCPPQLFVSKMTEKGWITSSSLNWLTCGMLRGARTLCWQTSVRCCFSIRRGMNRPPPHNRSHLEPFSDSLLICSYATKPPPNKPGQAAPEYRVMLTLNVYVKMQGCEFRAAETTCYTLQTLDDSSPSSGMNCSNRRLQAHGYLTEMTWDPKWRQRCPTKLNTWQKQHVCYI